MKIFSLPVHKTSYGLVYILAKDSKEAFKIWKDTDTAENACCFEPDDVEVDSGCTDHDMEIEETVPNGVTPLGGNYKEYLETRYNELSDELNKIAREINNMKGVK